MIFEFSFECKLLKMQKMSKSLQNTLKILKTDSKKPIFLEKITNFC